MKVPARAFARPAQRATTAGVRAVFPFVTETGTGARGVYVGRDLHGGSFFHDPFDACERNLVTGPNMVVFGRVGRGKSALVKSYIWRQVAFGRHAIVIDPKGEYGPLARACGSEPLRLAPGGNARLNPFGFAPGDSRDKDTGALGVLLAFAGAALGRALAPVEKAACARALETAASDGTLVLPRLVDAFTRPAAVSCDAAGFSGTELFAAGREVAFELRRLCDGDLRGMFDGPTSPRVELASPVVVIDLSAVYGSAELGLVMALVRAFVESRLQDAAQRCLVVLDEAWAVLGNLATAQWLRSTFKLARSHGTANVCVLHRPSDLGAAGDAASEQVRHAEGLVAESETCVLYAQPAGEVDAAVRMLGLNDAEAALLPGLGRGLALWKVGSRRFLVAHRLGSHERVLTDSDADSDVEWRGGDVSAGLRAAQHGGQGAPGPG